MPHWGGDATSASTYQWLTGGLGLSTAGIGWFGAFISVLWIGLALALGKAHENRHST
jgi:hypothetical protein